MRTIWLCSFLLFGNAALAADSVLVTAVDGQVGLEGQGVGKTALEAFMRLNVGDRLNLPTGSRAVLVYVAGGRLESWRGSGALLVGQAESKAIAGKPELQIRQLPPEVAQQMNRTPTPNRGQRFGMVRLAEIDEGRTMARASKSIPNETRMAEIDAAQLPSRQAERPAAAPMPRAAAPRPTEQRDGKVPPSNLPSPDRIENLESKYRQLRSQTPTDDLTPEIFLLAGFFELRAYERIEAELQRLSTTFPDNAVATALRDTYLRAVADAQKKAGR